MERNRRVSCDTPNPNLLRFCDHKGELFQELGRVESIPYTHEFKFFMAQRLPYDFNVGFSVMSFPGNPLIPLGGGNLSNPSGATGSVIWTVPATVFPGGVRPEAVVVPLVSPGVRYGPRWNQFDVSLKRSFKVGRYEIRGLQFDEREYGSDAESEFLDNRRIVGSSVDHSARASGQAQRTGKVLTGSRFVAIRSVGHQGSFPMMPGRRRFRPLSSAVTDPLNSS
jgi:hypothetical protein